MTPFKKSAQALVQSRKPDEQILIFKSIGPGSFIALADMDKAAMQRCIDYLEEEIKQCHS